MKVWAITDSEASTTSVTCTSKMKWGFFRMLTQNLRGKLYKHTHTHNPIHYIRYITFDGVITVHLSLISCSQKKVFFLVSVCYYSMGHHMLCYVIINYVKFA